MSELKRKAFLGVGIVVILVGIVIAPLPGPGGIPVIALGAVILLRHSGWARKSFVRLKQRFPSTMRPVFTAIRWRRKKSAAPRPQPAPPAD
ncbi:MAG: hypothetical protein OHK0024_28160 [Thalassobaculales bacterium]